VFALWIRGLRIRQAPWCMQVQTTELRFHEPYMQRIVCYKVR